MNLTTALIKTLDLNPSIILPLVREVPSDLLRRRPAPHEWSAHEIACHIEYAFYNVFVMFRHLALHDMMHAYSIEALLLKPDWT